MVDLSVGGISRCSHVLPTRFENFVICDIPELLSLDCEVCGLQRFTCIGKYIISSLLKQGPNEQTQLQVTYEAPFTPEVSGSNSLFTSIRLTSFLRVTSHRGARLLSVR